MKRGTPDSCIVHPLDPSFTADGRVLLGWEAGLPSLPTETLRTPKGRDASWFAAKRQWKIHPGAKRQRASPLPGLLRAQSYAIVLFSICTGAYSGAYKHQHQRGGGFPQQKSHYCNFADSSPNLIRVGLWGASRTLPKPVML